ncbi:transglycosylase SLT domain-containing protein [Paucibacter sp. R3-3]|uniref:Transglycosylase SLT domain-containing protein n=1 Tax=Roseateles agri TaxID=3098619 RepID=A0ABU5DE78_9BURK|nr:transglycosylase SLT domain-containing protein [Paucibacter sp. R3-3]MDY0743564.1 transglycosylase SLT domain-containing protein [Paucibacter sp. R3-3]
MKRALAVYGAVATGLLLFVAAAPAQAPGATEWVLDAKDAVRTKDRKKLATINAAAQAQRYPLAPWIDYWDIGLRLSEVSQPDLDAFYARWPGSYVEDRLRNDWLLELGHRRDWRNFATEYPRFQMRDDREVLCYSLVVEQQAGGKPKPDFKDRARAAWLAQKDGDEGCQLLASTLFDGKLLKPDDVWLKLRLAVEAQRPRAVKQAAALLGTPVEKAVAELQDNAGKYMTRKASAANRQQSELATLTLLRVASADPDQAAALLRARWERALPTELAAAVWAQVARQAAFRLMPEANDYFDRALSLHGKKGQTDPEWSDETFAWAARAALRGTDGTPRWPQLLRAIGLLSANEQNQQAWRYWRARALIATATDGAGGDPQRAEARSLLQGLATPLTFYGQLAADDLNQPQTLPAAPAPLTPLERGKAQTTVGLARALQLISLGLRNEGVREWNFSLRGLSDRELLAAAQEACDREVWDRCISASDRTKSEIDLTQRYPTPFRRELLAKTREVGVDPAYVYGLIRQESRFVIDARSHVGASGLMQVMPATAKWTAKKAGIPFSAELMQDREFNIKIGASYLKLVLDDFGGSMAMAAAAYNAGPGRPRRWRDGPLLDAAIWTENIPFNETRDYVKNVLVNTTVYAQLLGADGTAGTTLRSRLGKQIGPKGSAPDILPTDPP